MKLKKGASREATRGKFSNLVISIPSQLVFFSINQVFHQALDSCFQFLDRLTFQERSPPLTRRNAQIRPIETHPPHCEYFFHLFLYVFIFCCLLCFIEDNERFKCGGGIALHIDRICISCLLMLSCLFMLSYLFLFIYCI